MLSMIRKAGKDDIGGADIRKSHPGVGQNIKAFVQKTRRKDQDHGRESEHELSRLRHALLIRSNSRGSRACRDID